jgi:hypothetical protein
VIRGFFKGVVEIFRWENIELDDPAPRGEKHPSFLEWLLKPETLPRPAVSVPPGRTSFWNWLFVPEKLSPPTDDGSSEERPSLLTTLFSKETLPRDPVPEKRKSRRRRK